jgi:biopolymer transport protein ExbD
MAMVKRGKEVFAEINITPLTDVCLVLLVIFMVTATVLTKTGGLDVETPKASEARDLPPRAVEFVVTKEGGVFIDGQSVPIAEVKGALAAKLSESSMVTVVIKADADAPYRYVAAVMDASSSVGAKISMAMERE